MNGIMDLFQSHNKRSDVKRITRGKESILISLDAYQFGLYYVFLLLLDYGKFESNLKAF